ncbi:MAG TPA: hypothetical protein VFS56_04065 [Gemmatimonadaceae bacterium]|nr:hypothetical protein [Gemmatimonadaceae bacterium]
MRARHERDAKTPPVDPALADLSRDLVKSLLAAGDSYAPGVPPAVQHTLTVLCTTAHDRGVPPEGVLKLLKRTWRSYVADAEGVGAREMWYDDLISQCIHDFYETTGK